MNKIYVTILVLVIWLNNIYGQQKPSNFASKYTTYIDSLFSGIDKKTIKTGILYDRAVPKAGLQYLKQNVAINRSFFYQAYKEIRNAAYDNSTFITTDSLRAIADIYTYRDKVVPIGLMNYQFSYIDTLSIKKGLITLDTNGKPRLGKKFAKEGVKEKEIFIAAILSDNSTVDPKTRFVIAPELILKNTIRNLTSIKVDFEDGLGFRTLELGKPIGVNYSKGGAKKIIISITDSKGAATISETYLNVSMLPGDWGLYMKNYLRRQPMYADIQFKGYDESVGFRGLGWVTYLFRNSDRKIRKPVLIVDGFDPGNERTDDTLFFNYLNKNIKFADMLYQSGYDLVILDLPKDFNLYANMVVDGGGDFIERNAMVAVKTIQDINQQLASNGSTEKLVVIGPSMGGLITRYALAYMEKNGLSHNTRLWVSFDSPHGGANIPIGIQYLVDYFLESDDIPNQKLNCTAAKQMLLHHHFSGSESPADATDYRNNFISSLNSIGFPQNLRKITVLNGSLNGTSTSTSCTRAATMSIKGKFIWGWSEIGWGYINTSPSYGNRCLIFKGIQPVEFSTTSKYAVGLSNSFSLDNSPGGTNNTFELMSEDEIGLAKYIDLLYKISWDNPIKSHSFIPTKSAFAFTGSNQDLAENLSERNLVATGETPFQSYWGPMNKNMKHISFDPDMSLWLMAEINGLPQPPRLGQELKISGPSTICYSGATFTASYLPLGCTISWDKSANLSLSTASGNSATFNVSGNDYGWVQATISFGLGSISLPKKDILVGPPIPQPYSIQGPSTLSEGSSGYYTISNLGFQTWYQWYIPKVPCSTFTWGLVGNGDLQGVTVNAGCSSGYLRVKMSNECGFSTVSKWIDITSGGGGDPIPAIALMPNPASGSVQVTILKDAFSDSTSVSSTFVSATFKTFTISIIDSFGKIVYFAKKSEEVFNIPVYHLMDGIYTIIVNDGKQNKSRKLIVKH